MKNYILLLALFVLLSCQQSSNSLKKIFSLPKNLKEVSGVSYSPDNNMLWTLEDSGNANAIYALNNSGTIVKTVTIENTKNIDWEDITKDKAGNLYVGDFGNNENIRQDLCIYKMDKKSLDNGNAIPAYKISFAYPQQKEFPPKKSALLFDVEGFFEFKNNFYLFTKNRSKGFDGTSYLYKVPNVAGFHQAQFLGEFKTCDDFNHCAITSASISPDDSKVVVLSHDKIWLFENFTGDNFLKGIKTQLSLNHFSQKEAICFKDNETLIIADEKTKKIGGNVYEVTLKKLKSKS
ncbi:SdiA-regulated domain-containing protein [Flavobacterium xinjiangense]|jgi:WD40 repeat protein|uniref:SdiA-regulated n=1 Tax=Flavobacterium xinjiangense TaxID=178356 RepID=A0A1M7IQV4_9FLAO|nr:SdiA-regulated domain-containing protein [Flavobacterium xinjiangense]SHM43194.1 SdiA-regulated [Flavobacterium xinjiangense]